MIKFGLACEGPTDYAVLLNLLFGIFEELEEDDISRLQPLQGERGGWTKLIQYITHSRFLDDLEACHYVIVQIDTDIADEAKIAVNDAEGNRLGDNDIVENTIQVLTDLIKKAHTEHFEDIIKKVIFATSVESIECWLINSHAVNEEDLCKHDIKCFDRLKALMDHIGGFPTVKKKSKVYNNLTKHFYENSDSINNLKKRDESFSLLVDTINKCQI
ncbi:hypothetical protein NB499_04535 [Vibrio alginolyticus]|uniref:hypothetical protein n=1 Tax=Vibrio alginolyticus TaxID=663 RepID=UPI002657DCAB|nr:hypothetical protein [Vibrio alginolyticus]MCR9612510.1 hypothetical protein [Vibrio alginolyticus]